MLDDIYGFLQAVGYHHPIHPTEVHMPIGLVVATLAFSLAARVFHRPILAQVSRYCFILAFLFLFPTIIFGIMDWQYYYNGLWLHAIRVKLVLAGILFVLLSIGVFLNRRGEAPFGRIIPIYSLSFLTVVALGYYGGELVLGGRAPYIPPEFRQAESIFNAHCAMCHPGGGNIANPKLPLRNAPQLASFNAFVSQIRNPTLPDGRPGNMPPISREVLSDEEAWDLYQFIVHVMECPPAKR
jgi:uncharacterized membrane protein